MLARKGRVEMIEILKCIGLGMLATVLLFTVIVGISFLAHTPQGILLLAFLGMTLIFTLLFYATRH
jgi:hypothetical protein